MYNAVDRAVDVVMRLERAVELIEIQRETSSLDVLFLCQPQAMDKSNRFLVQQPMVLQSGYKQRVHGGTYYEYHILVTMQHAISEINTRLETRPFLTEGSLDY